MHALATIGLVVLVAGCLFSWILDDHVLSRLRGSHPNIWQALGPPTKVFDDLGMTAARAVEEFCRRSEYHSQCESGLVRLAVFARGYRQAYAIIVAVALLWGAIYV